MIINAFNQLGNTVTFTANTTAPTPVQAPTNTGIAHELAEVCPQAVTGEKDAVEIIDVYDSEGNVTGVEERPKYQGIDTSFLVATLAAAIQELAAKVAALEAKNA